MSTHLVLPDSHACPDHNNRRYDWLGKLIVDLKPDVVIDIGDFFDMASLSAYDSGAKKAYEGRRYQKDITAGLEAQDRVRLPLRVAKRKLPRFVRCLGNHEDRITRALEGDPVLRGTIGLNDLQSKEYGWEEHAFLEPVDIDGVVYSHYFVTGVSGKPISGENVAKLLLQKNFKSSTQGHSHLFDYAVRADADGRHLHGLVTGCYVENNLPWADATAHMWHKGVSVCRNVENGQYDLQWISINALKKEYGG